MHKLARLRIQLLHSPKGGFTLHKGSESSFFEDVKSKNHLDPILMDLKEFLLGKSFEAFSKSGDGVLRYQGRLCVLEVHRLRMKIFEKAYSSRYFIHQ